MDSSLLFSLTRALGTLKKPHLHGFGADTSKNDDVTILPKTRNVAGQTLSASIAQDKVRLHRFELETFECILHPAQFRTFVFIIKQQEVEESECL